MALYHRYIIYNDDGKIMWLSNSSVSDPSTIAPEYNVMEGTADSETEYILNGQVTPRPTMNVQVSKTQMLADATDTVAITALPTGDVACRITTSFGETRSITVTDSAVNFTTDEAGSYTFKFEQFPYQDYEVTINAT